MTYSDSYSSSAASPNHHKFKGKERDTETSNDDFGARYYTWRFGRWLSADWSSVPVAVPYANLTNPQTLNLYAMVADDPESFADLDGHCDPGPGCALLIMQAVQNFADNTGEFVKAFVWGAVKQELSTVRDNVGLKPAPELEPSNDVERGGAAATEAAQTTAAVVLPLVTGGEGAEPAGSFAGPKEGSSGGQGAGEPFSSGTMQAAVDENAAANGGSARCVFCGNKVSNEPGPNKVNIDHAVAKSSGGNNTLDNAQVTCQYCNQSKGTGTAPKNPKPKTHPSHP